MVNFVRFLVVSYLAIQATAVPSEQTVKTSADGKEILSQNLSGAERFLGHVERRSTMASDERGISASIDALRETEKLIRMAAMLPPEALQLVRMTAVPLLDTALAVPANVLEGAATMPLEKARSYGNSLWQHLAHLNLRHKHFLFHKNLTFGPLSLKKIVEIGAPKVPSEVLPYTTPAPVVVAGSAPPPVTAVVTESPVPPKTAVPCAVAGTPAPPTEIPPVLPVAVPVVVNPTTPNDGSTAQIAIVQQSPPAETILGDSP